MKRSTHNIVDEWLVVSAQAGDREAFERLLKRWSPRLFGYAMGQIRDKDCAWDVTQETLIQVAKGLNKLQDPGAFAKWIYQILQRRCFDEIKTRQRQRKLRDSLQYEQSVHETNAFEHNGYVNGDYINSSYENNTLEEGVSLNSAMNHLNPELQQVVRLFYLEGFNANEIGEILLIPQGTVKSRLYKARQILKALLEDK